MKSIQYGVVVLFFTFATCFCMFEKDKQDFELYQKRYNFVFRRCPDKDKKLLCNILHTPKKRRYNYVSSFVSFIDASKNYFDLGGTIEDFEKKDKKCLDDQTFYLKKIRSNFLEMLIHIVERQEDFLSRVFEKSNYFRKKLVSNNEIVMSGARGDSSCDAVVITIKNLSKIDEKERNAFKKRLAGHYKIHIMPQEQDILNVTKILMKTLKSDKNLGVLIDKFKITSDLSLRYQGGNENLPYPMMVIYPAEGKENVQKLLDKLLVLFKDSKGLDLVPRYNLKVNDLIFYAQGDADFKKPTKEGKESEYLKYFDKDKNYALYKDDFGEQPHESYELKF